MLLTKTVKVKWSGSNRKHYENLGYVWTKQGDEFEIPVYHLPKGSHTIVKWECDGGCGEIITGTYQTYMTYVKENGKIYCNKCKKDGIFKSFEDLCLELGRQDLLDRWDTELNGCLPSEVSYSSHTPRWFKCDKYPEHHSELKNINSFANGHDGTMDCIQCKSVAQSVIDMYDEEYLWKIWNKELNGDLSPWDIKSSSNKEVWWNCHNENKNHEPYFRGCDRSKKSKYKCPDCYNVIGENNPRWDDSKTQEEREKGRLYPEYTQFIKDVMARDNYTCQITGITSNGHNLVVHHLDGYNWCKEKRTDIDNGIVIHKEVHKLFHKLYGKGNNTKEQFNEFLMKIEYGEINIDNIK